MLKQQAAPILTRVASILRVDNHAVRVEGHTDAVPAAGSSYPTNWELASYPVENHGFSRPDSWTDEYRRIFDIFERSLKPGAKR